MLTQKVAVVTGANKGLGFAIVKALCKEYDGKVYLTSRDEKRGLYACEDLKKDGLHSQYFQLDVTNGKSIEKFVKHIQESKEEIDVLINNAGILFLKDAPEAMLHQAQKTIEVNCLALVNFTEAVLPLVRNGARIVNISSSSGHLSRLLSENLRREFICEDLTLEHLKRLMNRYLKAVEGGKAVEEGWGESPYVVSKVGVNAFTFMLHRLLANRGIKVNCVHPGYVISEMTRGAGNVTPEEAAKYPVNLALHTDTSGLYVWHDGTTVPWDGPDPREYIDRATK